MGWDLEPPGESLQRALRWISGEREADPSRSLAAIVEDAGPRFDLTPLDVEYLWRTLVRRRDAPEG
ncbi:MAG: hypothetical protein WCJ30_16560 [Deltaproteobacteria bacterium]